MAFASTSPPSIPFPSTSPSAATRKPHYALLNLSDDPSSIAASSSKLSLHVSAAPKARFIVRRKDSVPAMQLQRPLSEYMSLPASQYSVLDAEGIKRVDEETCRCYVYRFKFFALEVCPVLVVQVEVKDDGCIKLVLSDDLPYDKFEASMTNRMTYSPCQNGLVLSRLTSDAVIKVNIDSPSLLGLSQRKQLNQRKLKSSIKS